MKKYLKSKLNELTFFFDKKLDFYQYYRSKLTFLDEHYFIRGEFDIRLCIDSSRLDRDTNFSTEYDYKVTKINANEMLRIYINKKLDLLKYSAKYNCSANNCNRKTDIEWTGLKRSLVELGYAIYVSGDVNHGNIDIKKIMSHLEAMFNVDFGDYYRTFIDLRNRKKDRTSYLSSLIEKLTKKMDEDD